MRVEPGFSEPSTSFAGSIKLNSVTCEQHRFDSVFSPTWPMFYWECDGATHGALIANAASRLENQQFPLPQLQDILGYRVLTGVPTNDNRVNIYAIPSVDQYHQFFGTQGASVGVLGLSHPDIRVSASFDLVRIDGNLVSIDSLPRGGPHMREGTIIHELGHQLDWIWALPTSGLVPDGNFIAAVTLARDRLLADNDCSHAFTPTTCAEPAIANATSNLQRFNLLDFKISPEEVFAYAFQHSMCQRMRAHGTACSDFPDLEKVLDYAGDGLNPGYFDAVRQYVDNLIDNPPPIIR
jgi:hypothetical protein